MWQSALTVVLTMVLFTTTVRAQNIQLPAAIYDNAAGEWAVEVLSSCRSPTYGKVEFQNTTAHVQWDDEDVPDMQISGQPTDAPLSLAAVAEFMTKDGQEYSYKTCELQENYLATPQRPATVAQMTSTYMTMYTGVLSPFAVAANCAASADRTVMIQALGTPFKAGDKGQWRLQEALQFIEIIVETRNLAGTCARIRSTDAADTTLNRKRRSRKHRSGRGFNSAGAVSQADEALMENGVLTIRFVRRSGATPSWATRYYTPIVFATIVIVYRVVHSFVSTKAAKTPL